MYVEILAETAPILRDKLEEGKVVIMKKFVVEKAKDLFKVVPGAYMIKLNKRTEIYLWTHNLRSFQDMFLH
jgi:replication factor A1